MFLEFFHIGKFLLGIVGGGFVMGWMPFLLNLPVKPMKAAGKTLF